VTERVVLDPKRTVTIYVGSPSSSIFCAHAAAGLSKLVESGKISSSEQTVDILIGTGLKTTHFYEMILDKK
jgi:hypothetical protein